MKVALNSIHYLPLCCPGSITSVVFTNLILFEDIMLRYHTVRTFLKSNRNIVKRSNTYNLSFSWLLQALQLKKSGGVKLVLLDKPPLLVKCYVWIPTLVNILKDSQSYTLFSGRKPNNLCMFISWKTFKKFTRIMFWKITYQQYISEIRWTIDMTWKLDFIIFE